MSLKNTYTTYQQNAFQQTSSAVQEMQQFTKERLQNGDTWYQALACLEKSIDLLPEHHEEILDLHNRIFTDGLDFKASVYLNEEDYAFHFENLISILDRLAGKLPVVYSQLAFQYNEARAQYQDSAKVSAYLDLGIAAHDDLSIAVKGYFLYYGHVLEKDETTGLQLLNSSEGVWVKLYRAYIQVNNDDKTGIPELITALKADNTPLLRKSVLMFEAHCLDLEKDAVGAKSIYEAILREYDVSFAHFRLGTLTFNDETDPSSKTKAFKYWQESFERGFIQAVETLGFHSLPENDEEIPEQAIYWFEHGHRYNSSFCSYRLALLYLFHPKMTDLERGIHYLDAAVKNNYIDAIIEKGEILIGGEIIAKDEKAGLELLQKAIALKSPYAFNRLGYLYETGAIITDRPDVNQALAHYLQASDMNFTVGINNVGRLYRYGILGEPDYEKAKEFFEKAVTHDSPWAMTELAFMYEDGSLEKDYKRAFELFHKAALLGYPYAVNTTGNYLEYGYHNETPDPAAAFEWYLKGAELNYNPSFFEVGRAYRYGNGVEENPDKAIEYYQKGADAGNAKALVELALCYEHEYGVSFDAEKAFHYMQQAADQDYYYAQYKLGYYYMHGLIEKDTQKALEYLGKAAEAGSPLAPLQIGDYYLYDYDELDQADKAFGYYQKAIELDAVNEGLGICYEYGIGTEDNPAEAFKYYEMAANRDYVVAMYHAALCYLNGIGVKENAEAAYNWFHQAAQYDNVPSQYHTGYMLLKGKGVMMNQEEGLEWLNKAAEEDYADAQFELGNCFLMADGVEENEEAAMYWFERAAENGHEKAIKLTGRNKVK